MSSKVKEPPRVILCRRRAHTLRSAIVALSALGGLCCQVRHVRALLDGLEAQVGAFGADVHRSIQADLNFDFVLGPDADGLIFGELEETLLKAHCVVVGD